MPTRPYRRLRKAFEIRQPLPDWSRLTRDDDVTVVHPDGTTLRGRVDIIAIDRSVFWLLQENGLGRLMVCASDKCSVSKSPRTIR